MRISSRIKSVSIEEWYRIIGKHKYKFNVTKWQDGEAVFSVWQRERRRYLEIHRWRIKDGKLTGTYLRSNN